MELSDGAQGLVSLTPDAIDRILRHVGSANFDVRRDIEPELFDRTFGALNKAVDLVFGAVNFDDGNYGFVSELKYNNAVFAAFKTHCQQNEIHAQMFDDKGSVRSFADFRRAASPIIGQYNDNWLQTEYSTAILRSQNAAKQLAMEKTNHLQPNREWLPSTSPSPRIEHQALYGKVFAADDPILVATYPGCLWNCKCGLRATSKPVSGGDQIKAAIKSTPKSSPGLDENPIVSRSLFSPSHPYIANCGTKTKRIVALQCDKMISARSRNEVRSFFKDFFKGKERIYPINNAAVDRLNISFQDIKNITGKPHKFNYFKNQACYILPEIMKMAIYEGCSSDIKPNNIKHNSISRWLYYSFDMNHDRSFIVVKESVDGIFRIHSIQDADHFKSFKIKEKP